MPKSLGGVIVLGAFILVSVGVRSYVYSQRASQSAAASSASYDQHKAKMHAVLAGVASNPKLKDAAKDIKIDAQYIESVFDQVHDEAWDASTTTGRSFTIDEYTYMDTFFKRLSARALADHKNELSAAIDRVNLYTAKTDTTDWQPLPGSTKKPRQ